MTTLPLFAENRRNNTPFVLKSPMERYGKEFRSGNDSSGGKLMTGKRRKKVFTYTLEYSSSMYTGTEW